MDSIIIIGSGVIIVLMVIGAFIVMKDQTAPIGPPPSKKGGKGAAGTDKGGARYGLDFTQQSEISNLIRNDQKIEAIRVFRLYTNSDLKTAKEAVDAWGRQGEVQIARPSIASGSQEGGLDVVRDLIRQGRKIEAIKELREQTGFGLAEAKEQVERMESGQM